MEVTREDLVRMFNNSESALFRYVIDDILELHSDSDEEVNTYLNEVVTYGASTGIVTSLIYTSDCRKFVTDHIDEVLEIYNETKEFLDPKEELSVDRIAWLVYEYICSLILSGEPVSDFNM